MPVDAAVMQAIVDEYRAPMLTVVDTFKTKGLEAAQASFKAQFMNEKVLAELRSKHSSIPEEDREEIRKGIFAKFEAYVAQKLEGNPEQAKQFIEHVRSIKSQIVI